jgi:hypothetical protein
MYKIIACQRDLFLFIHHAANDPSDRSPHAFVGVITFVGALAVSRC